MDTASIQALRDERAAHLVRYAARHVLYYRKLFRTHGLDPASFRNVDDLRRIPVSTKAELRKQPIADLVSDEYDLARLQEHATSGSSGIPFRILRSWFDERCMDAVFVQNLPSQGVRPRDRVALLTAHRPGCSMKRTRTQKILNSLRLNPYMGIDSQLPPRELLRALDRWRPRRVMGFPSALLRVAEARRATPASSFAPESLHTFGEVLTPDMRERLTRSFGVPVFDIYGSYEFGLVAFECGQSGTYHIADDAVHLEILRDGKPVAEGESGVLTATNLVATAMPFIRFDIGDLASRGPASCACGWQGTSIREIRGRMLDMFPLPDGRELHPYDIVLKLMAVALPLIARYQLVQESVHRIVLLIIPATPEVRASQFDSLRREIADVLGPGVRFEVRFVDHIGVDAGGKFRVSRSNVRSDYEPMSPATGV